MRLTNKDKKFNLYDNYYWGFLAFFVPIIGAILIYYWAGKNPKSVKGMGIALFILFVIILLFGVIYG